ncbi:MAG: hypothetical protein ACO39X_07295 [Candidatus Nanopelagicaceae bacterium]
MNLDKAVESLLSDVEVAENAPKWIAAFRDRYYAKRTLPFLVVYQAAAIASSKGSSVQGNLSAAIAIATKQLQDSGCLLIGTNSLSVRGDIREIAVMTRLGQRKVKEYIRKFESV